MENFRQKRFKTSSLGKTDSMDTIFFRENKYVADLEKQNSLNQDIIPNYI